LADPHPSMTAWRVQRRGNVAVALLLAAVSATIGLRSAFVAGWHRDVSTRPRFSPLSREVYSGGHGGTGVILIRPPAKGFAPDDTPSPRELSPVVPGFRTQEYLFFKYSKEGYPISEVFMQIEGKTIWKKLGEIAVSDGDFEAAIQAQWLLLSKHSYYLFRKAHFFMVKPTTMKFGYTNEKSEIVTCKMGPMAEATDPLTLKSNLRVCGFLRKEKPKEWGHTHTKVKDRYETRSKDKLRDWHKRGKQHLIDREYNYQLKAHKWYNPDKYLGRYNEFMGKKRGLVVGCVSGR